MCTRNITYYSCGLKKTSNVTHCGKKKNKNGTPISCKKYTADYHSSSKQRCAGCVKKNKKNHYGED